MSPVVQVPQPASLAARTATVSQSRRRGVGLRFKFFVFVSIAFIGSGMVFGWVFSRRFESMLRWEFQKRGETLVRGLATNSRLDVYSGNQERLSKLVKGSLEDADIVAAGVYDSRREELARAEKGQGILPARPMAPPTHGIAVEFATTPEGQRVLRFRAPVVLQREAAGGALEILEPGERPSPERAAPSPVIGLVEIVLSLAEVERRIGDVQRTTLQITGVIVGVGIVLVLLLSRVFVTPIERIAAIARRIAAGDRRSRASVGSRDELGELADAFNTMTAALAAGEEELRRLNVGLEQMVRERTAELELKQHELIAANVELERASRLKSEFLANMSHELRTPLNAVNGFSELLLEEIHGPLTPKQRRYADNILSSGKHLLQLINDILDLSKIEAGRMEMHLEEFSIRQAIENAVAVIQPLAQKKGLAVEVSIGPDLELVALDVGKTKQILYNLMSNAVKFTDAGTVTVTAARVASTGDRFEIVVVDTGIGIKPEDQARIFREFEQVDGSHSRKYEGTGLGLALTRKLVELQGGTIRVESQFGRGSRFIVQLPVRAPAAASVEVLR